MEGQPDLRMSMQTIFDDGLRLVEKNTFLEVVEEKDKTHSVSTPMKPIHFSVRLYACR